MLSSHTALLLIDLQQDYYPGGLFLLHQPKQGGGFVLTEPNLMMLEQVIDTIDCHGLAGCG